MGLFNWSNNYPAPIEDNMILTVIMGFVR